MGTVGLIFAPLAPLVAVGAALVMWICSWVYKYQLMFCYITKVETGGVSPLPAWSKYSTADILFIASLESDYQPSSCLSNANAGTHVTE